MTPYYQAPITPLEPRQRTFDQTLLAVILLVISLHFLFLALGMYWNSEITPKKTPQKVIVKTVQLNPRLQAVAMVEAKQESSLSSSIPTVNKAIPTTVPKEESPPTSIPSSQKEPEPSKSPPEPVLKEQEPVKEILAETPPKQETLPHKPAKIEPKPQPKPAPKVKPDSKPAPTKSVTAKPKPKPNAPTKAPAKKPIAPAPVKTTAAVPEKKQPSKEEVAKSKQEAEAAARKREQEIAAAEESERQYQQVSKDILAKLKQSRHKVSAAVDSSSSIEGTAGPQLIGNLHIDSLSIEGETGILGSKERTYSDEIGFRLKKTLQFPEYGSVKIKLTLDKTGKVIRVQTVDSENKTNQQYIERTVPTIKFASFGSHFDGASQYTFLITLNNDRQR